jgi:diaminopimelate epimerase
MGAPSFTENWMPDDKLFELAEKYNISRKEIICVDMGNPHLVIFSKLSTKDMNTFVKLFVKSTLFNDGVNVNFVQIKNNEINLKVYERGTGFTLACGSGACASYAAARKLGHIDTRSNTTSIVNFEKGSLKMKVSLEGEIIMRGAADYVFSGEYYL